jgi:hypothetical protein
VNAFMSILIRMIKKKTARGKSNNRYVFFGFGDEGVFDIPYESDIHRPFVLNEIRTLTSQPVHTRHRKLTIAFRVKQAKLWSEAIGRNAPLLKGFFDDEPEWRNRMLTWCDRILAKSPIQKKGLLR